ncbi:hypothetical protein [Amycolatopsis sp. cmx-8-4]|uniref:hypothetical protein n=1 Tax=Amycolatopsis sp. cmx-8-4 TaxID=2790947 RepID=UPI00397C1E14
MTKNDAQRPQTAEAPHRNRALRYAAIAAAVLVAVGTILLVTHPNDPPPVDYHVAVTANISATWVSDDSDGTLDLTNGGNSEKTGRAPAGRTGISSPKVRWRGGNWSTCCSLLRAVAEADEDSDCPPRNRIGHPSFS